GRFDISNWGLICARRDGVRVGGAVIAWNTPGLRMLGGRDDLAVRWDIRVAPGQRGAGIGSALFRPAADWAGARRCRGPKSERQHARGAPGRSNQRRGCPWGPIARFAYPGTPGQARLLWWRARDPPPD